VLWSVKPTDRYSDYDIITVKGTEFSKKYYGNDKVTLETIFHESYHAMVDGRRCDERFMLRGRHSKIEETFAECSGIYCMREMGVTGLAPTYSEYITEIVPALIKQDKFKGCKTLADIGKIAYNDRLNGASAEWQGLYNDIKRDIIPWKKKLPDYLDYIEAEYESILHEMVDTYGWKFTDEVFDKYANKIRDDIDKCKKGEPMQNPNLMRDVMATAMTRSIL
jgi:hypothetical protein